MKYFVAILLLIHGLIHLMGFLKGYGLARLPGLNLEISRTVALIWFLTALCFFVALVMDLMKQPSWATLTLIAIVFSQALIISSWQDTKAGTVLNLILLIIAGISFAHTRFERESDAIIKDLLTNSVSAAAASETETPPLIRKWLSRSGSEGKKIHTVRLRQKGRMRTSPESKWLEFEAEQYVNLSRPGFIWTTEVKIMPGIFLSGRDRLEANKGTMKILLLALYPVVNEADNPKINSGTLIRFISECCWYPQIATDPHFKWTIIDDSSAAIEYTIEGLTVKGSCSFTQEGDYRSFRTKRFYGGGDDATEEDWVIAVKEWKNFQDVRAPSVCEVSWDLAKGRFHWLTLEVIELEYNPKIPRP
jgi:hypothetical protein